MHVDSTCPKSLKLDPKTGENLFDLRVCVQQLQESSLDSRSAEQVRRLEHLHDVQALCTSRRHEGSPTGNSIQVVTAGGWGVRTGGVNWMSQQRNRSRFNGEAPIIGRAGIPVAGARRTEGAADSCGTRTLAERVTEAPPCATRAA
eukprot:Polyplicarium_translucidae@DN2109_c0_g1_i1.p2